MLREDDGRSRETASLARVIEDVYILQGMQDLHEDGPQLWTHMERVAHAPLAGARKAMRLKV